MESISETVQNIFLMFLTTMNSIFVMMHKISDFYGEYGLFFFIFLLTLYGVDTYISKTTNKICKDTKLEQEQDTSIYPKWKIFLVIFVGFDCFFYFGLKDNITYFILFIYLIYVLRRLLAIMKFKKTEIL